MSPLGIGVFCQRNPVVRPTVRLRPLGVPPLGQGDSYEASELRSTRWTRFFKSTRPALTDCPVQMSRKSYLSTPHPPVNHSCCHRPPLPLGSPSHPVIPDRRVAGLVSMASIPSRRRFICGFFLACHHDCE